MNDVSDLRCLLGDDSPVFADGVEATFRRAGGIVVVERVATLAALAPAVDAVAPDVVVAGFEPPRAAVEALGTSAVPVLVLTWSTRREDLVDALRAGAHGYLRKTVGPGELVAAVGIVAAGGISYPHGWEQAVIGALDGAPGPGRRHGDTVRLTRRERDVVGLVLRGATNKQIAHELGIATQTAKNHLNQVMAKLGVVNRAQLGLWALAHGFGPTTAAECA